MQSRFRVHFFGATETVTGSKYLLECSGRRILVDCGLFQGKKELRLRNWQEPPFDPASLDAVVLTHAHIDHSGYLPVIVQRGYRGPIYCTNATKDLLGLLLPDSAYLQEEEARFANKHGTSKHHPAKPLYTQEDAQQVLKQLVGFAFHSVVPVTPEVTVRASFAGHILGAAALSFESNGRRVVFSGDIGRFGTPLMVDPEPVDLGDLFICESTYGDRKHATENIREELAAAVNGAVEKNGALVIPAFAIGRTQLLLYLLSELEREGKIPVLPVCVDSPMAVDATKIYRAHQKEFDQETQQVLSQGDHALRTEKIVFSRSREESKALNGLRGTRIIISAAGMATGGRILHHLRHLLPHESTTVLFVGFQAEGTRGRLIQAGTSEIRIFGQLVTVRAGIETISSLSAHGDQEELLRWIRSSQGSPALVRIVHGEKEPARVFSAELQRQFGWNSSPALYQEVVEV